MEEVNRLIFDAFVLGGGLCALFALLSPWLALRSPDRSISPVFRMAALVLGATLLAGGASGLANPAAGFNVLVPRVPIGIGIASLLIALGCFRSLKRASPRKPT